VQRPWASYLHLCASVTKQHNLVPVKGRLPCDSGVQIKVWSVCEWPVKQCDPIVTHGSSLTSIVAVLRDSLLSLSLLSCMTACW